MSREESDDFVGAVRLRIVENDYDVLRRFRGESTVVSYLAVVIASAMREQQVRISGRWRPSAEARRQGAVAIRLEALVHRSGVGIREAAERLRSSGLTAMSDQELGALLAKLPRRTPLRRETADTEALEGVAAEESADSALLAQIKGEERSAAEAALNGAIERLPPDDRLILRLRFWEGLSVADTARALSMPQKPLYRRLEKLLHALRQDLESTGLLTDEAQAALAEAVE